MLTNRLQIAGNAGQDAELRQTQSGKEVASFSVAHTTKKGEQEYTTWVRVNAWESRARYAQMIKKGDHVFVEGPLSIRTWEDQNGETKTSVEVTAFELGVIKRPPRNDSQQGGGAPPPIDPSSDDIPF